MSLNFRKTISKSLKLFALDGNNEQVWLVISFVVHVGDDIGSAD